MIDVELLSMSPSDLIALYEQCRCQPRNPRQTAILKAIEHRAAAADTGSLDCLMTGISYKWDAGAAAVVRLVMPPTLTNYRRQQAGLTKPKQERVRGPKLSTEEAAERKRAYDREWQRAKAAKAGTAG